MITVIGGSGNVGRELVAQLHAAGRPVRIVSRRRAEPGDGVERVVGDLRDPATVARALAGAERLFWVLVPGGEGIADRAIVEEARRAGVRQVVLLSSMGVQSELGLGRFHREREEWLEGSGLDWTFLRPGYFMSNALQWTGSIIAEGRVRVPAPDGRVVPIAPRDIAEVAARVLTEPGHAGKSYTLTGDEPLSAREQVGILSRVLDRPLTCEELPIEAAAEAARRSGRPPWMVESLVAMWTGIRSGAAATRTDELPTLLGHPPETFDAWCRAHRARFESAPIALGSSRG